MNLALVQQKIEDFFKGTGIHSGTVSFIYDESQNTLWCSLEGSDSRFFIGRGAEGLSALNHLVRKVVEKEFGEDANKETQVIVDMNGYQKKRIESLHAIAHMMAERARFFKSSVEVDPMPAFERRVIHEYLSNAKDVKTESTGDGRDRRVVIKYVQE